MNEKYSKQSIDRIDCINQEKLDILKQNKIKTLGQLCKQTRTDLKNYGLESYEINKMDIELQLLGLRLNGSN